MPTINRSALVMHTPAKMYRLVNAVQDYPEFLPWCAGAEILKQSDSEQTASILISMAGVRQTFTTCNTLAADTRIDMQLVDGPFSALRGSWQFQALGDAGCKVMLDIEYHFSNALLAASVSPVFNKICVSLVDAFCERADTVYSCE